MKKLKTSRKKKGKLWIGTSGWVYKSWAKTFYPEGLPQSDYLRYYNDQFSTAEINYSFYRLPSEEAYINWASQVDRDFIFAVKASRFLTHMKKLKDPEDPWHRVTSRASLLGRHLGPILLQFPAGWKVNLDRLKYFLDMVNETGGDYKLAFEFRHETWFNDDVLSMLKEYGAALCIGDSSQFIRHDAITADFTYIRYHGRKSLYAANYSKAVLKKEAAKIEEWLSQGTDVYAYFNNDAAGHAVNNAETLIELLS